MIKKGLHLLFCCFFAIGLSGQDDGRVLWSDIAEETIDASNDTRWIVPETYRTLSLKKTLFQGLLSQSPVRNNANNSSLTLAVPLPNGTIQQFAIVESSIMEEALAAKFPNIKTYSGKGIDDPYASIYLDVTPAGVHAMILSPSGAVFIDPYLRNNDNYYVSYYKKDYKGREDMTWSCGFESDDNLAPDNTHIKDKELKQHGKARMAAINMRTYRIAIAATGEYTAFHSAGTGNGTVAEGLAAINTALNRVRGVYETELAVSFTLVANNDQIVYTDPATDPYSNSNPSALLSENQANLDNVIGSANYDVGHVFTTGGGGLAALGVICNNNAKARGETGLGNPIGDPFYIDFVAHELGHQFAGNHTFNGSTGNCSGGNRNGSTAYEPGSGSTIQAYAGICGTQNLQNNSDPYFHLVSLNEMRNHVTNGSGGTCGTVGAANNEPIANANVQGVDGKNIPASTPFELTGSATDPDGDNLTYNWEQWDLGPQGNISPTSTTAPTFRSFIPTTNPTRTFPRLSDILNNTTTYGEVLSTVNRALKFQFIARDDNTAGGYDADLITLNVVETAGPFLITSQNTSAMLSGVITVTWDVANTTAAPISCANVDILVSTDGGQTFPTILADDVPNDGSQAVNLAGINSTTVRIKVKCADNVFFDINNADLMVEDDCPPTLTVDNNPIPDGLYKGQNVTSMGTVPSGGNVTFRAENAVTLNNNFTVIAGATFTANIASCIDPSRIVDPEDNILQPLVNQKEEKKEDKLAIFPNPALGTVSVQYELGEDATAWIGLYNANGELMREILPSSKQLKGIYNLSFNSTDFPPGIYYSIYRTKQTNISKKLVFIR